MPTERCHVTGDGSLRITPNLTAENRDISGNPCPSIQPRVTTENAHVSRHLCLVFHGYASPERQDVARDLSADVNITAEAGQIADFFTGSNIDTASQLSVARVIFGERRRPKKGNLATD